MLLKYVDGNGFKREYTAVLDNAYNVGYEKIENQIGNLEFSMPLDDPKNEFLQRNVMG